MNHYYLKTIKIITKSILAIALLTALVFTSCRQTAKQERKNNEDPFSKTEKDTNLLIGSWVQPNPINDKEIQGIKINEDGTAESINMATLLYKKWWRENDRLVLVSASIGTGLTIIDTTKYEIIKLNQKELEIRDKDYSINYKKQ